MRARLKQAMLLRGDNLLGTFYENEKSEKWGEVGKDRYPPPGRRRWIGHTTKVRV